MSEIRSAHRGFVVSRVEGGWMAAVIIGIDPHKGSHTAVAVDQQEVVLGEIRVRSNAGQTDQLLAWGAAWPERTWAVEGAAGLGYLLSQQLVNVGEKVLDVQPKLAAKVRLLESGSTNKNDPNDARSVAVAALRGKGVAEVRREDHAEVMKIWIRRRRELQRTDNRMANRLHALLCELVPGGFSGPISPAKAERVLSQVQAGGAVIAARIELAQEMIEDLRRLRQQRREVIKRLNQVVVASGTSTTGIVGVGPVVAAMAVSITGDVRRFKSIGHFAAYNGTAPVEVSSGPQKVYRLSMRGNRQLNHAIHIAAVSQISHNNNLGRAYYERKLAEGKSSKMALRALKRRISDALYRAMIADLEKRPVACNEGPGGQTGNDSHSSAASSHPERQLFGQATPGPAISLRPPKTPPASKTTDRRKIRVKKVT
jgi:transposase